MEINKINYEKYVLDFIEGTMNASDKRDFNAFLRTNPAIYDEIKEYLSAPIMAEEAMVYTPKRGLRKRMIWPYFLALGIIVIALGGVVFMNTSEGNEKRSLQERPTYAENQDESDIQVLNKEAVDQTAKVSENYASIENTKTSESAASRESLVEKNNKRSAKTDGQYAEPDRSERFTVSTENIYKDEMQVVADESYAASFAALEEVVVKSEQENRQVFKIDALPNQVPDLLDINENDKGVMAMSIPSMNSVVSTDKKESGFKSFIKKRVIPRTFQDADFSDAIAQVKTMEDRSISLEKLKDVVLPETFTQ